MMEHRLRAPNDHQIIQLGPQDCNQNHLHVPDRYNQPQAPQQPTFEWLGKINLWKLAELKITSVITKLDDSSNQFLVSSNYHYSLTDCSLVNRKHGINWLENLKTKFTKDEILIGSQLVNWLQNRHGLAASIIALKTSYLSRGRTGQILLLIGHRE